MMVSPKSVGDVADAAEEDGRARGSDGNGVPTSVPALVEARLESLPVCLLLLRAVVLTHTRRRVLEALCLTRLPTDEVDARFDRRESSGADMLATSGERRRGPMLSQVAPLNSAVPRGPQRFVPSPKNTASCCTQCRHFCSNIWPPPTPKCSHVDSSTSLFVSSHPTPVAATELWPPHASCEYTYVLMRKRWRDKSEQFSAWRTDREVRDRLKLPLAFFFFSFPHPHNATSFLSACAGFMSHLSYLARLYSLGLGCVPTLPSLPPRASALVA